MPTGNDKTNQQGWKTWVAPVMVSAFVFGLLAVAEAVSTGAAVALAIFIIVFCVALLRFG
jgi:hypothetical protein